MRWRWTFFTSPFKGRLAKPDRVRISTARPIRIVANLPYNIATALLVRWLAIEPVARPGTIRW